MKKTTLTLIRSYQRLTSHYRPLSPCRFSPTCSQYSYEAIAKYGNIKGILLGFKRILKCHPFSKGGHDPLK